ncbi:MAG TPA: hypothetical protein VE442_04230 [Jatrophihabitans sp.]|jgi:hypothetical protein|nr:hypothetical protein [Jatrophihabitans sp.]
MRSLSSLDRLGDEGRLADAWAVIGEANQGRRPGQTAAAERAS